MKNSSRRVPLRGEAHAWPDTEVVPDAVRRAQDVEHLETVLRLGPAAQLAHLCTLVALIWQWRRGGYGTLAGALLLALALCCLGWWAWSRVMLTGQHLQQARDRIERGVSLWVGAIGLGFGLVGAMMFPGADAHGRFLLGVVAVGSMAAGALSLAALPRASLVWLLSLAAGSAWALWQAGEAVYQISIALLAVFVAILAASVRATAHVFDRLHLAHVQVERERAMVGVILGDFERQASDWMWETDLVGRCTRVPQRLATWLGRPAGQLQDRRLIDLMLEGLPADDPSLQGEAGEAAQRWQGALGTPCTFRGITLPLMTPQGLTWWNLGATPLFDSEGHHSGWRGVAQDITVQRRQSRDLHRQAATDALTGLANRHAFVQRLCQLFAAAGAELRLLILDLDEFKTINDVHGHGVGDAVLREVARRLAADAQPGEFLARLGGDEFSIVMPGPATPAALAERLDRLLAVLRQPLEVDGQRIELRASVGVAAAPRDAVDVARLMRAVDLALQAVKQAGGDGWRLHDNDLAMAHARRRALRADLASAIGRGEFHLVYQPQVRIADGRVVAFEALLRWDHPQRGAVPPAEFIELAEASGLIVPLGAWVLTQACRDAVTWPERADDDEAPPLVAVNLSAVQLASRDLLATVEQALRVSGLPPQRLELEVTESAVLREQPAVRVNLAGLRAIGVRVALDDFGTGHSSLAHLRVLAPDALKIDQSFVQALPVDAPSMEIVRSLLNLTRTLGMSSVAEGVETAAQLERLIALGCERVQGHHCGRALLAEAVVPYLARSQAEDGRPLTGGLPHAGVTAGRQGAGPLRTPQGLGGLR